MMASRMRRSETAMALIVIAISAAFLFDGRSLQPSPFEPVGSGAVPNGVAWIAIALSALLLAGIGRTASSGADDPERWGLGAASIALLVIYVGVLSLGMRYQWATIVYFGLAILLLAPEPRRALPWAAAAAVAFGFGLDYLFRVILVTDLP